MAVEALRWPAVGQGEAERAAEGLAVEAAFGMRPQAQAPHHLVGVQRSPLTSARGEGAALSGARHGQPVGDAGPERRAAGRAGRSAPWAAVSSSGGVPAPAVAEHPAAQLLGHLERPLARGIELVRRRCRRRRAAPPCSRTTGRGGARRPRRSSGQRLYSRATCVARCQLELSVRCTMPRNSRRLVRTLKIVGAMIRSRCASASAWLEQDHVLRRLRVGVARGGSRPGSPSRSGPPPPCCS